MTAPRPGNGARHRPNSTDVALRAGVSRATVSYVLNDVTDEKITQQTRERVIRAARLLGYNIAAPQAWRGTSRVVLVESDDQWGRGPRVLERMDALSARLSQMGLLLVPTGGLALDDLLTGIQPAILLLAQPLEDDRAEQYRLAGIPVLAWEELSGLGEEPTAQQWADVIAAEVDSVLFDIGKPQRTLLFLAAAGQR